MRWKSALIFVGTVSAAAISQDGQPRGVDSVYSNPDTAFPLNKPAQELPITQLPPVWDHYFLVQVLSNLHYRIDKLDKYVGNKLDSLGSRLDREDKDFHEVLDKAAGTVIQQSKKVEELTALGETLWKWSDIMIAYVDKLSRVQDQQGEKIRLASDFIGRFNNALLKDEEDVAALLNVVKRLQKALIDSEIPLYNGPADPVGQGVPAPKPVVSQAELEELLSANKTSQPVIPPFPQGPGPQLAPLPSLQPVNHYKPETTTHLPVPTSIGEFPQGPGPELERPLPDVQPETEAGDNDSEDNLTGLPQPTSVPEPWRRPTVSHYTSTTSRRPHAVWNTAVPRARNKRQEIPGATPSTDSAALSTGSAAPTTELNPWIQEPETPLPTQTRTGWPAWPTAWPNVQPFPFFLPPINLPIPRPALDFNPSSQNPAQDQETESGLVSFPPYFPWKVIDWNPPKRPKPKPPHGNLTYTYSSFPPFKTDLTPQLHRLPRHRRRQWPTDDDDVMDIPLDIADLFDKLQSSTGQIEGIASDNRPIHPQQTLPSWHPALNPIPPRPTIDSGPYLQSGQPWPPVPVTDPAEKAAWDWLAGDRDPETAPPWPASFGPQPSFYPVNSQGLTVLEMMEEWNRLHPETGEKGTVKPEEGEQEEEEDDDDDDPEEEERPAPTWPGTRQRVRKLRA